MFSKSSKPDVKVLMFGWEFPPHISGGLGTACYGLAKALSEEGTQILFVMPKAYGDEEAGPVEFVNASDITIPYKQRKSSSSEPGTFSGETPLTIVSVASAISPYHVGDGAITVDLQQWSYQLPATYWFEVRSKEGVRYNFSGSYGTNLMEEVNRYAEVALEIARGSVFDIIHAHDWLTYPAGIAAKEISGKPLVVHVHATEFDRAGEHVDSQVFAIEREGMEKADRVIAVSQWTKDIIVSKYFIPEEKVLVVHNGVSPKEETFFSELPRVSDHMVTFLGRITHQKGPEYFVEAACLVLKKFPDAHFIMAGSGDLLPEMILRVAKLKMSSRFHFTGFLKGDQVDKVWSVSNVYVMPSVSEPFGIAPLEAIQAGVPVIISNQSGVSEVMPHAIKVDFWNIDALANAICQVLEYKSLSRVLRKNGEKEIKKITWERAAKKINKLYYELLNQS